jgi:preprotein translocase subunit SecE
MFKKIAKSCKESYNELVHKVTWPTFPELTSSAVLVLEASIFIALVVFAMDQVFQGVMEFVYPH